MSRKSMLTYTIFLFCLIELSSENPTRFISVDKFILLNFFYC